MKNSSVGRVLQLVKKKFWEEIIYLLPLYKLTVNYIQRHHPHTNPYPLIGSKVAPTSEV
jgi:hypothetical protein